MYSARVFWVEDGMKFEVVFVAKHAQVLHVCACQDRGSRVPRHIVYAPNEESMMHSLE